MSDATDKNTITAKIARAIISSALMLSFFCLFLEKMRAGKRKNNKDLVVKVDRPHLLSVPFCARVRLFGC